MTTEDVKDWIKKHGLDHILIVNENVSYRGFITSGNIVKIVVWTVSYNNTRILEGKDKDNAFIICIYNDASLNDKPKYKQDLWMFNQKHKKKLKDALIFVLKKEMSFQKNLKAKVLITYLESIDD